MNDPFSFPRLNNADVEVCLKCEHCPCLCEIKDALHARKSLRAVVVVVTMVIACLLLTTAVAVLNRSLNKSATESELPTLTTSQRGTYVPSTSLLNVFPEEPITADEDLMLKMVNSEREKVGAPNLTWCPRLALVATAHSQDMANRQYFKHEDPDGVTPAEREKLAGYDYAWSGENIAVGQETVQDVMDAWMKSPGHRENILRPEFTHFGSGIAKGNYEGRQAIYWTQNFGAGGNCKTS